MGHAKKLTLFQLIGITMAFFATVRNVPTLAINGWTQIVYFIGAAIIFAIPIALIAAELATGWPEEGGPQVWVTAALGERWGFVTSWLLWVQMMTGMVMVSTTIGVLIGYIINNHALAQNNVFIFICIVCGFWAMTFLNFKFDMVKIVGNWGALIGVYIPFLGLIILGTWYFCKFGINPHCYLGNFTVAKMLPNVEDSGSWTYFAGMVLLFAGLEISSVHANNIENPSRNYPIAVIASVLALVVLNLWAGMTVANAIPQGTIQLANIIQPFAIYTNSLGVFKYIPNIMAFMILIGVLGQISAWILGPSKAMIRVAEEGNLPPIFQKRTKSGIPTTFVIIQAIVVTLIALANFAIPNINSTFFMVTITTTILYSFVYIFICIAAIVLRYKKPDVKRSFRLGSQGNALMWFVSILALLGVLLTIVVSLIPPSIFKPSEHTFYICFQVVAATISIIIPLVIFQMRKPSWKK